MEPCPFQGPGKQNPVNVGGYDNFRESDTPADAGYWIGSGESIVYDAALNRGVGGNIAFNNLLRISKGAVLDSSEECDCTATVTLDIEGHPAAFQYFPPHSLDVIFVLDVTSSMMSAASTKFVQAKRAMINTINQMWAANRDTTITIIPYGRDAFRPNPSPSTGLSYEYEGTLFTWRRSSGPPPGSTHYIGQILGYRNQSFVSVTEMSAFLTQTAPLAASAELSLYNYYNYYQIRYSDIYDDDGNPLPDTVLSSYITNVYTPQPTAYTNNQINAVASGTPLTPIQLTYSMDEDGYANNSILQNLVWAIPYSEDTNTEAGLQASYQLFQTPGFAQSDDINRRVVILITDGQANRSLNPAYPGVYAAPGNTDATFFPAVPGEPWRYFLYLEQTLPTLVAEVSNRSATFNEIILASQRSQAISSKLTDSGDGNVKLYALGINIDAQTPGPCTRQNVIELMKSWVTAPSFFREANTDDPESQIAAELAFLVQDILNLYAGSLLTVYDLINTALFDYVPGSIVISGTRDGLKLRSPNQPVIIDPGNPDYTVYPKAPLLPDVGDNIFVNGGFALNFGTYPLGLLAQDSTTTVTLSYKITSNRFANGDHLHTNTDAQTSISYTLPNHYESATAVIDYSSAPQSLFFQTPIVACKCAPIAGVTIDKFADRSTAKPLDQVTYFVVVTNTGTLTLTDLIVKDPLLGIEFVIKELEPLQQFTMPSLFTIPAGTAEGPFKNVVFLTSAAFPDPLTATATVLIERTPSLQFSKTVNKNVARPGETVIFTLTAVNDGNVDLVNVLVTDELLGIHTTIERIVVGATLTSDFPYVIPDNAVIGSTILNKATTQADSLPPITVAVSVLVEGVPRLSLTKTVDQSRITPGTALEFSFLVTNSGDITLTNIKVADPIIGLDTTIPSLMPGQSTTIVYPFLIPLELPPDQYTNTATAVSDQTDSVRSSAEIEVIVTPGLGLRKIADRPTVVPGGTIQYEIMIANLGNVPLSPTRLSDPLLGIDTKIEALAVGQIITFTTSYAVPLDARIGSIIDNLITAESPEAGTVQAEAIVTVIASGLLLAKSVDLSFAFPGDTVIYTISVTNPLGTAQTNVHLIDNALGLNEFIAELPGSATITRNIAQTMPNVTTSTVIHNVCSCSSDQSPTQLAEADVVVEPELTGTILRVEKIPNGNVTTPGSTIIYSISVTNIGSSSATNIMVVDSLTGTVQNLDALAPGQRELFAISYTVPVDSNQGTVIRNEVVVTSPQANPVSAEADVRIAVPHFLLQLTNVVNQPVAPPGTTVFFTITVTNTSGFTLHNVRVYDDLTDLQISFDELAPGESRVFVRPFLIPANAVSGNLYTDTATAFSDETPFEQAPASVITETIADFTITETVDRKVVKSEETVYFTITVTNIGNVTLVNFVLTAPLLELVLRSRKFHVGNVIQIRVPFTTPFVEDDLLIVSPARGIAENAGPKEAEASVLVIPEDEE